MELHQLEMLLAVVNFHGYARAGEALHLSHSAIHRQIRLLEHELDVRLLARSGRGMELTDAGRVLVAFAKDLQYSIRGLREHIRDLRDLRAGRLRLGTGTAMLMFFLPPVLERFRREFPGVEVNVMATTAQQVMHALGEGELDIGLVFDPVRRARDTSDLHSEILYEEEFVWGSSKKHPLSRRKSIAVEELATYPLISLPQQSHARRMIAAVFDDAGLTPSIQMEVENEEAVEKMIEINMGVGLLTRRRAMRDHIHYFIVRGRPMLCAVGLVLPKSAYVPRAVEEFCKLCREHAGLHLAAGR